MIRRHAFQRLALPRGSRSPLRSGLRQRSSAQTARHARSSAARRSRSRRPACRWPTWRPTRPTLHRQARRHAVGHLQAVPEEPVALARAVGHEPRQIRNPHLIYPGQVLVLESRAAARACAWRKAAPGRHRQAVAARAQRGARRRRHPVHPAAPDRAVPQRGGRASTPTNSTRRRASSPRPGRPRADVPRRHGLCARRHSAARATSGVFREATPLLDPTTNEVLGYEARFVGTAELHPRRRHARPTRRQGRDRARHASASPASASRRVGVGDRLAPVPPRDFTSLRAARAAQADVGPDRLGLWRSADRRPEPDRRRSTAARATASSAATCWRCGATATRVVDRTDRRAAALIKLPDERHGLLFVFRVFDRVSYALILQVQEPVRAGDRFTQP